jgi:AP-1 complex subunit gamma-1
LPLQDNTMGDSYDSQRLKDLIQSFRDCKTAAEERALILREKAIIRNSFIEQEHQFKLRNLAKLIWINMLGFETDFGQLECLNSLCTEDFSLKKIGYLGLSIFFSEKSEILLMATNRIRVDLQDKNQYVVSLALTAFSEIADENMCRELLPTVLLKLKSAQKYIRKKAMLTSLRVLRKVPDLVSEFTPFLSELIDTKNHALLMCCLTLAQTVITIDPELKKHFKNHTKALMKLLKELSITYSTEYDCDGINDPFLQAVILEFLHAMSDDENIKDDFCGLLATLTCN